LYNDQWRYCFDDHLGSSAFEVDAQAKTISQEVYYPFGGTAWLAGRHEVETSYKTIRYSGKERDATGLYYYGARYYAPWLQRWLNPDPAGDVDGVNFYRFVRNGPVVYTDHDGHAPTPISAYRTELEQNFGVYDLVVGRGKNIRAWSPELADLLNESLTLARDATNKGLAKITNNEYDKEHAAKYFGVVDSAALRELVRTYSVIASNFDNLQSNPERIVLFNAARGRYANAGGFIMPQDNERYIYINFSSFINFSVEEAAHVLVHELSHQNKEDDRSKDYWYLGPTDAEYLAIEPVLGVHDYDDVRNKAMEIKSVRILSGKAVEGDIAPVARGEFIKGVGKSNIRDALKKFNDRVDKRQQMARRNADNLARFVLS
jgi:insecticidal toxin complex protein TccC